MTITHEQGKKFAADIMAAFADGFKANNHLETTSGLVADTISWDWSDGLKGEGPKEEVFDHMKNTWGFMVDSFILISPTVVVDTTNDKVVVTGSLVINITGGLKDQNNPVLNPVCFIFKLDDTGKLCSWDGYWDNAAPNMLAAMGKVTEALKA